MVSDVHILSYDFKIPNLFSKICKTSFFHFLINELSKINFENSLILIFGEKGTEKDETIKIILQKIGDCSVFEISEVLPKKKLPVSSENTVYIFKKVERFEESIINLFFDKIKKFKCVIFTSDYDPMELYKKEKLSSNIYERLSSAYKIFIPPLRERKNDIIPLANYFLYEISKFLNLKPKELSKEAKEELLKYPWTENTYQLKYYLTKAFILSKHHKLTPKDIFGEQNDKFSIKNFLESKLGNLIKDFANIENSNLYDTVIQEVEKALFSIVLEETGQNQLKASKVLGINRNTLSKKLKIYNLL